MRYVWVIVLCVLVGPGAWGEGLIAPEAGKRVKVFVLAGQSNMEGRADGALVVGADRERLVRVQDRVQLAYNNEPLKPLDVVVPVPGIAKSYKRDLIFGPELFFGMAMAEAWSEERILLIKRTQGGTSLYGAWNASWTLEEAKVTKEEKKPHLYDEMIGYVREVLSGYDPGEYELCGALWVQGENDAGNAVAAAKYGENLQELIRALRRDLKEEALPFVLFQVGKGEVVEGMKTVAASEPGVTLIPQVKDAASVDYYSTMENGHYNYAGMKKLGERFATEFVEKAR